MLDVHPPHEAAHTWKDFFIHIATIVVGLLIAVGLEQGVEALHRRAQRHELLHDIHAECENNLNTLAADLRFLQADLDWQTRAAAALRAAPIARGALTVALPSDVFGHSTTAPSRAVWAMAKSSEKVELLPENLAEVFDRTDREAEQCLLAVGRLNSAQTALAGFQVTFGAVIKPGITLHLTSAQRDQLLTALAASIGDVNDAIDWAASWLGASQAVLQGVTTSGEMDVYINRAHAELSVPK